MIQKAIEFITSLAVKAEKPEIIYIDGKTYCTKSLQRYNIPEMARPIEAHTLTALVDYIRDMRGELREKMIIHIMSPTRVMLYSGLLDDRNREYLFTVEAMPPRFRYDCDYDQESFVVAMQSCFEHNDDRETVLVLASNIVNAQQQEFCDDGVSQQATIRTGITTKERAIVPNPVNLIPHRTFREVEQPASAFVFRIRENSDNTPAFRLIEADGGRWEIEAMENIRVFLTNALRDIPGREFITIIA